MLLAEAGLRGVVVRIDLAPGLPSIVGDRRRIQESVSEVLLDAVRATPDGTNLDVSAEFDAGAIRVTASHGGQAAPITQHALARRVLEAHRGSLEETPGRTVIRFAR